jgi:2-oxoglutarate ferredoxin oxidoreductase subunit delta
MIVIDEELCKGCTYCINACPLNVIAVKDKFNKKGFFPASPLHLDKCTGCAMCAQVCPEVAIEVYREAGAART